MSQSALKRLATFVHISDLHFGELDNQTDDAVLDAHTEPWLQNRPWFDGYLGHSGEAIRDLDSFFRSIRKSESANLIVTGDLTTVGANTEFALASQYLTSFGRLSSGLQIGLDVKDAIERTVLGNHDHWPGKRAQHPLEPVMFGRSKSQRVIPPARSPVFSHRVQADLEVTFVRINSDSDVLPMSIERGFARGKFHSQLPLAKRALSQPSAGVRQVRVLLLHHSPSCPSFTLGMPKKMRTELSQFLEDTDTRVLLTGHVHRPGGSVQQAGHGPVLEGRCGTTTQRDTIPPGWAARPRPMSPNTLLVHRLYEDTASQQVEWEMETFVRSRGKGFASSAKQHIPGALGKPRVRVWP